MGGKKSDRKGPPARGLGGLADALVKAGVQGPKEARKARHERHGEDKKLTPEELRTREQEKSAARDERKRAADEASQSSSVEKAGAAAVERIKLTIQGKVEKGYGNKRWFFITRDGRVPFVDVADAVMRQLADGNAGIVESLGHLPEEHVVIGDRQALALLQDFDPEMVRFWNRGER